MLAELASLSKKRQPLEEIQVVSSLPDGYREPDAHDLWAWQATGARQLNPLVSMATFRDVPYGNARFIVKIAGTEQPGFAVVQLPELSLDAVEYREGGDSTLAAQAVVR